MKDPSVAIVTGASRGIGHATSVRLAHDFSGVVMAARNEGELKETAAAVKSAGAEPLIFTLDLREPELMAFMVSPAAKWMTGASVRMDGGEVKGI
jgi:NAD(P)-dependent dehydrogenase (short-subunit alcohol dehydrogenase family)